VEDNNYGTMHKVTLCQPGWRSGTRHVVNNQDKQVSCTQYSTSNKYDLHTHPLRTFIVFRTLRTMLASKYSTVCHVDAQVSW